MAPIGDSLKDDQMTDLLEIMGAVCLLIVLLLILNRLGLPLATDLHDIYSVEEIEDENEEVNEEGNLPDQNFTPPPVTLSDPTFTPPPPVILPDLAFNPPPPVPDPTFTPPPPVSLSNPTFSPPFPATVFSVTPSNGLVPIVPLVPSVPDVPVLSSHHHNYHVAHPSTGPSYHDAPSTSSSNLYPPDPLPPTVHAPRFLVTYYLLAHRQHSHIHEQPFHDQGIISAPTAFPREHEHLLQLSSDERDVLLESEHWMGFPSPRVFEYAMEEEIHPNHLAATIRLERRGNPHVFSFRYRGHLIEIFPSNVLPQYTDHHFLCFSTMVSADGLTDANMELFVVLILIMYSFDELLWTLRQLGSDDALIFIHVELVNEETSQSTETFWSGQILRDADSSF